MSTRVRLESGTGTESRRWTSKTIRYLTGAERIRCRKSSRIKITRKSQILKLITWSTATGGPFGGGDLKYCENILKEQEHRKRKRKAYKVHRPELIKESDAGSDSDDYDDTEDVQPSKEFKPDKEPQVFKVSDTPKDMELRVSCSLGNHPAQGASNWMGGQCTTVSSQ